MREPSGMRCIPLGVFFAAIVVAPVVALSLVTVSSRGAGLATG